MSAFTLDVSALSGTANAGAPTAISGLTFHGVANNWDCVVTAGVNPGGWGKYLRMSNQGSGLTVEKFMRWDTVGSLGANVDTEALCLFRINAITADPGCYMPIIMRHNGTSQYYALNNVNSTQERLQKFTALTANEHVSNAAAKVAAATVWTWAKMRVTTASGTWEYKLWADGGSEPAYGTPANSTTLTSGYVGFGAGDYNGMPLDVGWFSVGTAGTAAPSPSTGQAAAKRFGGVPFSANSRKGVWRERLSGLLVPDRTILTPRFA